MANFIELIFNQAIRTPRRIAINEPNTTLKNHSHEETYSEHVHRIQSISFALKKRGISRNSLVLILIPISLDFYAVLLAVMHVGASAILIDPCFNRSTFKKCIKQARPNAIISTAKLLKYRSLFPPLLNIAKKYTLEEDGISFSKLISREKLDEEYEHQVEDIDQNHTALITFTSGSSGAPKGVVRTHSTLINQHVSLKKHFPPLNNQVDLPGFPNVTLHNLCCGYTTILPKMDFRAVSNVIPKNIIQQIQKQGVNSLTGSPAYLSRITRYCRQNKITLPGVRQVGIGGAPVEYDLCREVHSVFHNAECRVIYGCSEAEPISSIDLSDIIELADNQEFQGMGYCVGSAAQVTKLKILPLGSDGLHVSPETNIQKLELSQGEIGEIVVSGSHVSEKYFQNESETRKSKILDLSTRTWHRTGDVGFLDKKNRIWLTGRTYNLVVVDNRVLYPLQVESVLNRSQGVNRSALSSSKRGRPVLWIESETTSKRLLPMINSTLNEYEIAIQTIFFTKALPVDSRHNSKIDYPLLRRWTDLRIKC